MFILLESLFTAAIAVAFTSLIAVVCFTVYDLISGKQIIPAASENPSLAGATEEANPCGTCHLCVSGTFCNGCGEMCVFISPARCKQFRLENPAPAKPRRPKTQEELDFEETTRILTEKAMREEMAAGHVAPSMEKVVHSTFHSDLSKLALAIQNPNVRAKVSEIINISDRIAAKLETDGDPAGKARNFTSYYMPTTLKLLSNYYQMETQGVKGENIAQTMLSTEKMLDAVVSGFKKMIDSLFSNNAMDAEADIKVMETLMKRDGLMTDGNVLAVSSGRR